METVLKNDLKNTIKHIYQYENSRFFKKCLDFKFSTLLKAFRYFQQHDLFCEDEDGEDYPQQWQLEMLSEEFSKQVPRWVSAERRSAWILTDDEIIDFWVLYLELKARGLN